MPLVLSVVSGVAVKDATWMGIGQPVFIETAGAMMVAAIVDDTHVDLTNLGTAGNAAHGTFIPPGVKVSPGGGSGGGGGGAVIFDLGVPAANIRSTKGASQTFTDHTKQGIVNFGTHITLGSVLNDFATLSGGADNSIFGDYGTVSGGSTNSVTASYATVPGGIQNTASGFASFAVGQGNQAQGSYSFASGFNGTAFAIATTCIGWQNFCLGQYSTCVGGQDNAAIGDNSFAGGSRNTAQGFASTVFGQTNTAIGRWSLALGNTTSPLRDGQIAHCTDGSIGGLLTEGSAQGSEVTFVGRNGVVGTPFNIQDATPGDFILEIGKSYALTIKVIVASASTGDGPQHFVHEVLIPGAAANSPLPTIVSDIVTVSATNTQPWTFGVSIGGSTTPGNNPTLIMTVDPGGFTASLLYAVAKISFVEITGSVT
jgi:hypothetical protein